MKLIINNYNTGEKITYLLEDYDLDYYHELIWSFIEKEDSALCLDLQHGGLIHFRSDILKSCILEL